MSKFNRTDEEIYRVIIELIRASVGDDDFTVIVGNQSGREPNGEFAVIYDLTSETVGMSCDGWDSGDTDSLLTSAQIMKHEYQIQFWRGGSHDKAMQFCAFVQSNRAYEILFDSNLTASVPSGVQRVDEEFGGVFVAGSIVTFVLQSSVSFNQTVDVIDDVELIIEDE